MYKDPNEAAQFYLLMIKKLGNEIADGLFKYIDDKANRAVITYARQLATKQELEIMKEELNYKIDNYARWMVTFILGVGVLILAITFYYLS
jgi:endonuclease III-like uncharacterized protein